MGHVRNYTIGDVLARFMRMQGYNVLQPMGWDAFGLPAENAAISQRRAAGAVDATRTSRYMRAQMQSLGFAIDWSANSPPAIPSYYRWNQWLFLRMLERGIAYQQDRRRQLGSGRPDRARQRAGDRRPRLAHRRAGREARDPDVLPAHHALRRGAARGARMSCRLARARARDAGQLDRPQRGLRHRLSVRAPTRARAVGSAGALKVFTTRADTLFGVTFMAVAAEHPLALAAARARPARSPPSSTNAAAAASSRPTSPRRKRKACHRAARACIRSPASARRCGSPTTCSWATARARSWACRRTMSAISSSRSGTRCRS